jgi:hypothetical protein
MELTVTKTTTQEIIDLILDKQEQAKKLLQYSIP